MLNNFMKHADGPRRARRQKKNKIHRDIPGTKQEKARAKCSELNQLLEARLAQSAMTADESAYIVEALDRLQVTVSELGEAWCARPFGSMASTFRTHDSDVDVTCLCKDGLPSDQTVASLLSEKLSPLFRRHPRFTVVEEVLHARVPILKLRFDDLLEIDLSCQNTKALQNTRLLRGYAQLDDRVRDFVIAVKLWAKAAEVCGASRGRLSSYAFTLLSIYFLQVHPEVQLPCLPTSAYTEDTYLGQDDEKIARTCRGLWSCSLSTVELLERFFEFYHNGLAWGHEVVSVRLGQRHGTIEPFFTKLRGRHVHRLHVEDPFLLERNLHCVLGEAEEAQLRQAFAEAFHCFNRGSLPVGLDAAPSNPPALSDAGSADVSGGQMLMKMLRQGKSIAEDVSPEAPLSDAAASTAVASSCSSDGGSGDEAPSSKTKHQCSSSLDSVASAAASTASRQSRSDAGSADVQLAGLPEAGAPEPGCQRWADAPADPADAAASQQQQQQQQQQHQTQQHPCWWYSMGSNDLERQITDSQQQPKVLTLQDVEAAMEAQQAKVLTLQDVEGMIGATVAPADAEQRSKFDLESFFARPRVARSTNAIAARVSKACLGK